MESGRAVVEDVSAGKTRISNAKDSTGPTRNVPLASDKPTRDNTKTRQGSVLNDSKDSDKPASQSGEAGNSVSSNSINPKPSSDPFSFTVSSREMASYAIAKLSKIAEVDSNESGMEAHQKKHLVKWTSILKSNHENETEVKELRTNRNYAAKTEACKQ